MRLQLLLALASFGALLGAACGADDAGPAEPPAPDASESQPVGEPDEASTDEGAAALEEDTASEQAAPVEPDEASTDEGAAALEEDTASEQAAPVEPVVASPALVEAFGGRVFARPIDLVSLDGGRFLVAEQNGVVLLIAADGSSTTFLDLRERVSRASNEEGLLSLALDPPFADPGHLWLYYSVAGGQRTRLSRFSIAGDAAAAGSELIILEIPQPFANHNGGAVRFGPDGMLYLGLGDGGAGGDPRGNGQNRSTLLGSIIRIDVQNPSPSAPYAVPVDNPFLGQDGVRPEIWAYGVRNPWRMSFDAETGRLWLGDVGQSRFEEIDIVERGANLGWNLVEGDSCFQGDCDLANFAAPVAVYDHDLGCSVTGGVVVRRSGLSYLDGAYVYGDFCSGRIWTIDADLPGEPIEILTSPRPISSFAEAIDGTVYALTFGGAILRFAAAE